MPYKSEKQRAWMHINKPGIAKKWDKKYGSKIVKKEDKGFFGHTKAQTLF